MSDTLTLHYAPQTRAFGVLALLEELGAPHELHVLDLKAGEARAPEYLALNPLGKVPVLSDGGAIVSEQVAIFLHLADRFPEAGLAPAIGDAARGPYLRWMLFYAGAFEPAVVDRAMQREPASRAMSPYGSFDEAVEMVRAVLARGLWILGDRFSAADILWGTALDWTMRFGIVPRLAEFESHAARVAERPAMRRARERDTALAAAQEAKRGA
jgi:glutathione S-transferase